MKRPTQKRINECLKDIPANFKELIDAIIWYERKDMDAESDDIIGYIEHLPSKEELKYLFDDISQRKKEDLKNPKYQRMWYGLLNVDQRVESNYKEVVLHLRKHKNKDLALAFIKSLDEGEYNPGEINVRKILSQYNDKPKP